MRTFGRIAGTIFLIVLIWMVIGTLLNANQELVRLNKENHTLRQENILLRAASRVLYLRLTELEDEKDYESGKNSPVRAYNRSEPITM